MKWGMFCFRPNVATYSGLYYFNYCCCFDIIDNYLFFINSSLFRIRRGFPWQHLGMCALCDAADGFIYFDFFVSLVFSLFWVFLQ